MSVCGFGARSANGVSDFLQSQESFLTYFGTHTLVLSHKNLGNLFRRDLI